MPPRFAAILFDMDGTLVESENIWQIAETEMFATRGIDYTDEVRQLIIGTRLDEMFQRLKNVFHLPESIEDLSNELIERMVALIPTEVKPKPGATEMIAYAAENRLRYCIASSSPLSIIDAVVAAQGWDSLIPYRYSADAVPLGKPAPDIYLYAAQQLGVDPAACLALEDSPNGARAAVAAGMTCYAVPDYHSVPAAFADVTPYVFSSLHDVHALLLKDHQAQ